MKFDYGVDDNDDLTERMGIGPDPDKDEQVALAEVMAEVRRTKAMAEKTHDLCVVTGKYTDRNGNEKNSYENIGYVMKGEHGAYILLKRTFSPAGIPGDKNMINVSLFKPKE